MPERRLRLDAPFFRLPEQVSPAWKARFGVASKHPWPEGFIAVKGSSRGLEDRPQHGGAIGYIDYSYVVEDGLTPVQLKRRRAVPQRLARELPQRGGGQPLVLPRGFLGGLVQMPGEGAWPITMGTYVALPKVAADTARDRPRCVSSCGPTAAATRLACQAKFVPLPGEGAGQRVPGAVGVVGKNGEPIGMTAVSVSVRKPTPACRRRNNRAQSGARPNGNQARPAASGISKCRHQSFHGGGRRGLSSRLINEPTGGVLRGRPVAPPREWRAEARAPHRRKP